MLNRPTKPLRRDPGCVQDGKWGAIRGWEYEGKRQRPWIPDQVGDDSKGKNRYDEIPREVLRFARDKLGMTMMVRLAPLLRQRMSEHRQG